ncbi:MAG: FctA domain-containing protein [Erysipelotrichaceae bacterium]|nr:FctA domain-containing protein [Erysipelotrichaceae bacterium]
MKLTKRNLLSLGLGALVTASMNLPVQAAGYTPVTGGTTSFDKYLIIDQNANVPNAEFSFAIAAGTAAAASDTSMEVLAGPLDANGPVITNTAVFTPEDTAVSAAMEGDIITLAENEKYASKTINVDFSNVSFNEPGIYRYVITETALETPGAITQDSAPKYLDVYVIDDNNSLAIASYVLHTSDAAPARNETGGSADVAEALSAVSDKVTGFINRYSTKDLTITKQVEGNQASKDKYFKYTLNIANAGKGTKLIVDVTTGAEAAPEKTAATIYENTAMHEANGITVLTCNDSGSVTQDFYLKHNQSITIRQIPSGAAYTLTEANEDYVSQALHEKDAETYAENSGTIAESNLTAGFVNTRNGVIPTGIITSVMPYALIVLAASLGMIMVGRNRMIR